MSIPYPTTPNEDPGAQPRPEVDDPPKQPIHPPLPSEPIHPPVPVEPGTLPGNPASRLGTMAALLWSVFALSGCAAIGDIFKAGVWVGVLVVLGLFALVGGGMALTRR